jgi:hypothetical protein
MMLVIDLRSVKQMVLNFEKNFVCEWTRLALVSSQSRQPEAQTGVAINETGSGRALE